MSVWGTGRAELARGFSWQHRIIGIEPHSASHQVSGFVWCGFAYTTPYALNSVYPFTEPTTFLRHPIACLLLVRVARSHQIDPKTAPMIGRLASPGSAWAFLCGYGNINPLSIDYACRPRLRSRLTLGGLAWPRNPWSSGGGVSHSSFATHACILTRVPSTAGLPRRFLRHTTLPYPSTHLAGHP